MSAETGMDAMDAAAMSADPTLVELTLRDLLAAIDGAFEAVPCSCNEAYYDRRMVAPDCYHHDLRRRVPVHLPLPLRSVQED